MQGVETVKPAGEKAAAPLPGTEGCGCNDSLWPGGGRNHPAQTAGRGFELSCAHPTRHRRLAGLPSRRVAGRGSGRWWERQQAPKGAGGWGALTLPAGAPARGPGTLPLSSSPSVPAAPGQWLPDAATIPPSCDVTAPRGPQLGRRCARPPMRPAENRSSATLSSTPARPDVPRPRTKINHRSLHPICLCKAKWQSNSLWMALLF